LNRNVQHTLVRMKKNKVKKRKEKLLRIDPALCIQRLFQIETSFPYPNFVFVLCDSYLPFVPFGVYNCFQKTCICII
jgi:hypothetical protein